MQRGAGVGQHGRTYAHICQVLLRHSICSCNNRTAALPPALLSALPLASISQLFHLLHLAPSACLAHCWLCLRVVMRSKLYLPSIVHDVKRGAGHARTHGMQRQFGLWGALWFFHWIWWVRCQKKLVFRVIKCFHLANMQLQRIYCIGSELIKAPNWPLTHAVHSPLARNVKLKSNAVKYANYWWPPFDWGAKQLLKGQSM